MAITNGYCTLNDMRVSLDIDDSVDDAELERVAESMSRTIDAICNRVFYSQSSQTRYYTAERADIVFVDDIQASTGTTITLKTDGDGDRTYEDTWAADDYDLMPFNAANQSVLPIYTWIERSPNGDYSFPQIRKGVEITANFGFASIPKPITDACILAAQRIYKRRDAPFGILGSPRAGGELRRIMETDPDVMMLLSPYIKR